VHLAGVRRTGRWSLCSYKQAYAAVVTARAEFEAMGVPHMRPDDYFAEMLKSDAHMTRVRGKLVAEKERIEAFEERKKAQSARKFAKQVQAERVKEKAAERKAQELAVTQWRKQRSKDSGGTGPVDSGAGLEKVLQSTGKEALRSFREGKNKRRMAKDKKYGMGGQKRNIRSNTGESSADTRGFSMKKNRSLPTGMSMRKPGRPGAGKGAARPGKRARSASGRRPSSSS
jgi:rRNA-processing protein EBP2